MKPFSTSYSAQYAKHWKKPTSPRIARDFIGHFQAFLANEFAIQSEAARCIASSVFHRMANPLLTYHNPLHILSMFDFAARIGVNIRPQEKLALLFHDVIYDPFAPPGQNENQSAGIAIATMTGFRKVDLGFLASAILATAEHGSMEIEKRFHLILDLDLCAFAWDKKNFTAQSAAVAGEFLPTLGKKKWTVGRDKFLRSLLEKGPIFRTPAFKRFEATAQASIRNGLLG